MPRNDINPIPAGFSSLPDYAKANSLDLVQLACAVWRGDMKGWYWTITKGKGVDPTDCVAIIVATDDKAPAYAGKARDAQGKEAYWGGKTPPGQTLGAMARALQISRQALLILLAGLGIDGTDWVGRYEYDEVLRMLKPDVDNMRFSCKKDGFKYQPDGYESIPQVAKRWGMTQQSVHKIVRAYEMPRKWYGTRVYVQSGLPCPVGIAPVGYVIATDMAKRWGVSIERVYDLIDRGKIDSVKHRTRRYVKDGQELPDYVRKARAMA